MVIQSLSVLLVAASVCYSGRFTSVICLQLQRQLQTENKDSCDRLQLWSAAEV